MDELWAHVGKKENNKVDENVSLPVVVKPAQDDSFLKLDKLRSTLAQQLQQRDKPQTPFPNTATPIGVPVTPLDIPNTYSEGFHSATERIHEYQINDLTQRFGTLEGTSSWVKGALWGIGIFVASLGLFVKTFWKGIVRSVLAEVDPKISKP